MITSIWICKLAALAKEWVVAVGLCQTEVMTIFAFTSLLKTYGLIYWTVMLMIVPQIYVQWEVMKWQSSLYKLKLIHWVFMSMYYLIIQWDTFYLNLYCLTDSLNFSLILFFVYHVHQTMNTFCFPLSS